MCRSERSESGGGAAWKGVGATTSGSRLAGAGGSVLWEAWAAPGGRHVLLCALCGSLRTLGD